MRTLAIFDFDGTLVDTITDVALCFNRALAQNGYPQHPLKAFDNFVGGNLETVVSRMLPPNRNTQADINIVKTTYRTLYQADSKPNTKPYPGVMELLDVLHTQGVTLTVNTNKGQDLTDTLIRRLFPEGQFRAVVGYREEYPSKPDPYGINNICNLCGKKVADAIYIGDGRSDIETARNAGIPCVLVGWGQAKPADLADPYISGPVSSPEDLLKFYRYL
jgi:phosphoglycolate phosphatase